MCDEHSPFWNRTEQRAALNHDCDECPFPIMRGERYVAIGAKFGDSVQTFRSHVLCDMLANELRDDEGCRLVGCLSETVRNMDLTPTQARWADSLMGPAFRVEGE